MLRTELRTGQIPGRPLHSIILVSYAHNARFDMLLPDDMNELYITGRNAHRRPRDLYEFPEVRDGGEDKVASSFQLPASSFQFQVFFGRSRHAASRQPTQTRTVNREPRTANQAERRYTRPSIQITTSWRLEKWRRGAISGR